MITGPVPKGIGMALPRACRVFCRYSAMVFVGITVYTVPAKALGGHLADDWMHSLLHLGSAAVAAYAGWGTRRSRAAVLFTGLLAVVYLGLGVLGWFVDGLLLGTPVAVPLGPADNVFHLLLGGAAATVLAGPLVVRASASADDGAP